MRVNNSTLLHRPAYIFNTFELNRHHCLFLAMLFINLQDRHHLAGPTPKHTGGAAGTPRSKLKLKNANLLTQNLKIAHQKVNLDLDFASKLIMGYTELTLVPTSNSLKSVKLDARHMKIKDVFVNGSNDINYSYNDMLYINDPLVFENCIKNKSVNLYDLYSDEFTIHQHHLIKQKLGYIFKDLDYDPQALPERLNMGNTEELTILLPENLKLEVTDLNSIHTPTSGAPTAGLTPMHIRSKGTMGEIYTPIQIGIYYEIINPTDGINFACESPDKQFWHAYTVNPEYNISASSWVPSIDNLWEKSTFSVEMAIPRSVKFIRDLNSEDDTSSGENSSPKSRSDGFTHDSNDSSESPEILESQGSYDNKTRNSKEVEEEADDDEEGESPDLFVCTGDSVNTKEMPHRTDKTKKVVSWSIFNPVCSHHLGWAVGAFRSMELTDFTDGTQKVQDDENGTEDYEQIEKDDFGTTVTLYFLPGQEELAKNTCIFARSALDFFLTEFGSYPFSSYGIVFVSGPAHHYNNFSGLSILSDRTLYPADIIDPMFSTTEKILECIASQWSGINIVPQTFNDLWCTKGIAGFMAFQFLRDLMGQNEFRFTIKRKMGQIVSEDVGKHPISMPYLRLPISESDLSFLELKSSVVLFILDRRMTKTDKLFGLSRVLPKIFLQAMSGDLQNGTLSTQHFQYVCEKVNRNRLDNFFRQWIYGTGTPVFNITQRFNKKRSLIEVVIRQTQHQVQKKIRPKVQTFVDDSLAYLNEEYIPTAQHAFLGPMTIRVHEADGTPYEHIVDIKDALVKFDVQYNTKSRRMRKNKDENQEGNPVFSRLGDILQSEADMKQWNFAEWPKRDEEFTDPYEWIRVDTDFEWIARVNVRQPDYMFGSQLQQDRDVEAQYEAIRFFSLQEKPNEIYCTALTRTLLDERYYYGVRIAAAQALADFSKPSVKFIGLNYLLKAFRKLFCFEGSDIPVANSFDDFGMFFLQKAFPKILEGIRDDDGKTPPIIRKILLNLVKYNDNSNNDFQDCFYLKEIIEALTGAMIPVGQEKKIIDFHLEQHIPQDWDPENQSFVSKVLHELDRLFKIDEWMPSYRSVIAIACLEQKIQLARNNLTSFNFEELMFYTTPKYPIDVRIAAFEGLLLLGGLKNSSVLKYFTRTLLLENSNAFFKIKMVSALKQAVCEAAINGSPSFLDDPEFQSLEKIFDESKGISNPNNMIVIEESQNTEMNARRDALARASIKGAIQILRRDYGIGKGIQSTFWSLIHTSLLGIREKKMIFILCEILFREEDIYPVHIAVPYVPLDELKKKIVAKDLGDGHVTIKREGRFRIQLSAKVLISEQKKLERLRADERIRNTTERQSRSRSNLEAPKETEKPPEKLKLKLGRSQSDVRQLTELPAPSSRERLSRKNSEMAKHSIVTRDAVNNMSLSFKFTKHRLQPITSIPSSSVTVQDGHVTIRLRNLKKTKENANRDESTQPSIDDDKPSRFVKVSTRTGSVSVSATPFPENENNKKRLISEEGDESLKKIAKPAIKKEDADELVGNAQQKSTLKTALRGSNSLTEQREVSSRASSPFSAEPSPGPKKKKKIYVHGSSKSQNGSARSSVLPVNGDDDGKAKESSSNPEVASSAGPTDENGEVRVKNEEDNGPKPKLKLKLNLK